MVKTVYSGDVGAGCKGATKGLIPIIISLKLSSFFGSAPVHIHIIYIYTAQLIIWREIAAVS